MNKNNSDIVKIAIITVIISVISSVIVGLILFNLVFNDNKYIKSQHKEFDFSDFSSDNSNQTKELISENLDNNFMQSIVEVAVESVGGFINKSVTVCTGNGVILTQDGYILTTEYIKEIEGDIYVTTYSGEKYSASVVGTDNETYITVLKIEKEDCIPAVIGNSSQTKIGEKVYAVGNKLSSSFDYPITTGIICGYSPEVTLKDGTVVNVFQTDASNMAGSIGGLLYNKDFSLIGISTAKFSVSSDEIAVVTPIDDTKEIVRSIIENTELPKNTNIGISGSDAEYGVTVENVTKDSPAEKAGIKYGDLIIKVNGESVSSLSQINKIKKGMQTGNKMVFTLYRNGKMTEAELILE